MKDPKRVFTFKGGDKRLFEMAGDKIKNPPATVGEWRGEFVKGLSEQFTGKVGEMSVRVQMKEACPRCGNNVVNFSTKRLDDGTFDGFLDCVQCFRRVKLSGLTVERVDVIDFEPEGVVEVEEVKGLQFEGGTA